MNIAAYSNKANFEEINIFQNVPVLRRQWNEASHLQFLHQVMSNHMPTGLKTLPYVHVDSWYQERTWGFLILSAKDL